MKSIAILFLLMPLFGWCQNLLPNPSFEETENCATPAIDFLEYAADWYNPSMATPDLYCAYDCAVQLTPQTLADTQLPLPQDGNCYLGLFVASIGDSSREYAQVQLLDPLEVGELYQFSFWLSIMPVAGYRANKLGVHLSQLPIIIQSGQIIEVEPQWEYAGPPLSPINEWIFLEGEFTALGGETFLTVGCFRQNSELWIEPIPNVETTSVSAYYVLDNLRLEKALSVRWNILPNYLQVQFRGEIMDINNNSTDNDIQVRIIDASGRVVVFRDLNTGSNSLEFDRLSNGFYILSVKGENFVYNTTFIK